MKNVRIGVIGTGAIGGFYGLLLARAGFDVHFLLRSEYAAVAENGLQLNSLVHGSLALEKVQAYHDVAEMPPCDWLLVGAKTTSNAELAPIVARAAAPGAKVLLLQNGLAVEESMRALLPDSLHLLGGLCYICVHRSAPGVIEHQALGAVHLGYHSGPASDAEAQLAHRRRRRRNVPRRRTGLQGHAEPGACALAEAGVEHPLQRSFGAARQRHTCAHG